MKIEGKITILINQDYTRIELYDNKAGITFVEVTLTPEQLSSALSRLAYTGCDIDVHSLDKLGKKVEYKKIVFEIPKELEYARDSNELKKLAQDFLDISNEGWISDGYFGSQDSFYSKGDKYYARCGARRWI